MMVVVDLDVIGVQENKNSVALLLCHAWLAKNTTIGKIL